MHNDISHLLVEMERFYSLENAIFPWKEGEQGGGGRGGGRGKEEEERSWTEEKKKREFAVSIATRLNACTELPRTLDKREERKKKEKVRRGEEGKGEEKREKRKGGRSLFGKARQKDQKSARTREIDDREAAVLSSMTAVTWYTLTISAEDVDELGMRPASKLFPTKRVANRTMIAENNHQLRSKPGTEHWTIFFR